MVAPCSWSTLARAKSNYRATPLALHSKLQCASCLGNAAHERVQGGSVFWGAAGRISTVQLAAAAAAGDDWSAGLEMSRSQPFSPLAILVHSNLRSGCRTTRSVGTEPHPTPFEWLVQASPRARKPETAFALGDSRCCPQVTILVTCLSALDVSVFVKDLGCHHRQCSVPPSAGFCSKNWI